MDLQMLALDLDFLSVLRSLQENALVKRYKNAYLYKKGKGRGKVVSNDNEQLLRK